ncbi:recombinase RecA [Halorhodospira neutriphila]|uniref:Protein RecA n=1 Tax=Halorhodospira neutriphila TaxID=168379 RepID=A0ABS1E1U6_9GAMM|nr:recombinase RecA [Halorhodospira neutriphila]
MDEDRKKALGAALGQIEKQFGKGAVMRMGDARAVRGDVAAISSGSLALDVALGIGGLPRGRVAEIYGPESSGKTTLTLHIIAEAQKAGGTAAFVDAEHALDPDYAEAVGVDINDLLVSQPDTGEQALEIADMLVRSGGVDVLVVDSVAALTPKAEIEGEMGDSHVGLQARLMSQALRKLTSNIKRSNTLVVFINQIRMKIGVMFGCFSYDSQVLLADGSREKIGKLVNQQQPAEVLSYNFEHKSFEAKPVTDWHVNGETDAFLQFFVQNPTGNGRRGFSCTPDHKIYTPYGWRPAKALQPGDEISACTEEVALTDHQEQVVIGALLGDGNITQRSEQTAYFREEHGPRQAEYAECLAEELGDIVSNVATTPRGTTVVETRHLLRLGDLGGLFYPEQAQKVVPESIVEHITPRAIAHWYCGDGSLQAGTSYWRGKAYQRRPVASLYVNGFTDAESQERIDRIFARFGIQTSWRQCGEHRVITFSVAESQRLFELIAPFVPGPMEYKLPAEYRGRYHRRSGEEGPSETSPVLRPMRVKEIRTRVPYRDGQRISRRRFDISVADNHNYFVDGCLVSNSPETTTGGNALKFYSTVRLDIRRVGGIKKGDEVLGNETRVKVVKNKMAPPFKQADFEILYGEGISREGEIIDMGVSQGIVDKSGAWYSYNGERIGQGKDNARQYLRNNPQVAAEIEQKIREQVLGAPGEASASEEEGTGDEA